MIKNITTGTFGRSFAMNIGPHDSCYIQVAVIVCGKIGSMLVYSMYCRFIGVSLVGLRFSSHRPLPG